MLVHKISSHMCVSFKGVYFTEGNTTLHYTWAFFRHKIETKPDELALGDVGKVVVGRFFSCCILSLYKNILPVHSGPRRHQRQYVGYKVHQSTGGIALVPPSLPQLIQASASDNKGGIDLEAVRSESWVFKEFLQQ